MDPPGTKKKQSYNGQRKLEKENAYLRDLQQSVYQRGLHRNGDNQL